MRALILVLLATAATAQDWVTLFDGKTPAGWVEITGGPFPASWTIEDGCLKSLPQEHAWQDIRTTDEFGDFELELEWKIAPGANAGVKYLIDKVDKWPSKTGPGYHARARGLEYQIIDNNAHADALNGPERTTAALYGKLSPTNAECRAVGEFNKSRIVVRGGNVEHWLNGRLVLTTTAEARKSAISLQHHNSAVWFRAIKVRTLVPIRNRLQE